MTAIRQSNKILIDFRDAENVISSAVNIFINKFSDVMNIVCFQQQRVKK